MTNARGRASRTSDRRTVPIVAVVGVLVIVGTAGVWRLLRRLPPEKVVARYMAACKVRNERRTKALLSADSLKALSELQEADGSPADVWSEATYTAMGTPFMGTPFRDAQIIVDEADIGDGAANVRVWLKHKSSGARDAALTTYQVVRCVRERGRWKVDVSSAARALQQRLLARGLEATDHEPRPAAAHIAP